MKRILLVCLVSTMFVGCASTTPTAPSDPYGPIVKEYAPMKPYAIAEKSKQVYFYDPSSKQEVDYRVFKVWTKDSGFGKDITTQKVIDCNSKQSMILQTVIFINGQAQKPVRFTDNKFSSQIYGTVGYGLIETICR